MDWILFLQNYASAFFSVINFVYLIFDPPKPQLNTKETVAFVIWMLSFYIMWINLQGMNASQIIINSLFFLLLTLCICKKIIWPKLRKITPSNISQLLQKLVKFLVKYEETIFFSGTILVVLGLLLYVAAITNIVQYFALTSGATQSVEVPSSTSVVYRMRQMEPLFISDETNWEDEPFWNQEVVKRNEITNIQFCKNLSDITEIQGQLNSFSWDVSAKSDHTVIACFNKGTLWVVADGVIELSENSAYLFAGFSKLKEVNFNGSIDSSYTTDMSNMFALCKSLTKLDLTDLNTENVKTMFRMFHYCESMVDLNLSQMDTSQVINMGNMFSYCSSLTTVDVSNFSTSNAEDIGNMFYSCESLESVDVSHFDTSNVKRLNGMFYGCANLKFVDMSNFDFSSIEGMVNVFAESSIHEIIVSDWPDIDEKAYCNFMSSDSTINGVRWDEFSKDDLT